MRRRPHPGAPEMFYAAREDWRNRSVQYARAASYVGTLARRRTANVPMRT